MYNTIINKKTIHFDILYITLLVFISFDTTRSSLNLNSFLNEFLSISKEVILLLLILFIVLKNKKVKEIKIDRSLFFFLFLFVYIIISLPISFFNGVNLFISIRQFYNYILPFFLIYVFWNLESVSSLTYKKCLKVLIYLHLILFFSSVYAYFIRPSFINRIYFNRISIGNPSTTSFLYILLFISIYFFNNIFKNVIVYYSIIILLFLAILFTLSSTALFSIFLLFNLGFIISFVYYRSFHQFRINSLVLFIIITIITILLLTFFWQELNPIYNYFIHRLENLIQVIEVKLGMEKENIRSTSYSLRQKQFQTVIRNMDKYYFLSGLGSSGYLKFTNLLENQYYALLANYGLFGLISYIMALISTSIYGLKKKNIYGLLLFFLNIIMSLYSMTLEIFICFSQIAFYSFFFSYYLQKSKNIN
jgi:hypothetical protein